jgi:hypothetical protein
MTKVAILTFHLRKELTATRYLYYNQPLITKDFVIEIEELLSDGLVSMVTSKMMTSASG